MQSADSAQLEEITNILDSAVVDAFTRCAHLLQTPNDVERFVALFLRAVHQPAGGFLRAWNARNVDNVTNKLPHEVLAQCISHLDPGERHTLLAVCQTWRDILLAESTLWTNISLVVIDQFDENFTELDEREAMYTEMMLGRSGVLPICLSVHADWGRIRAEDDISLAMQALVPHAHRITQIRLANVMLPASLLQGMTNLRSINTTAPFTSPDGMVFPQLTSIVARSIATSPSELGVPFPVLRSLSTTHESPISSPVWRTFPALVDLQFNLTRLESDPSHGTPPSTLERIVFQRPGSYGILGNLQFHEDAFMDWTRQNLPRLRLVRFVGVGPIKLAFQLFQALNPWSQWSMSIADGHASFFATATMDDTTTTTVRSSSNVTVAVRMPTNKDSVESFCRELGHSDVWHQVSALPHMTFDLADLHDLAGHSTSFSRSPTALWETLELHIGPRTDSLHWLQIISASKHLRNTPRVPSWPYPLPQLKRLIVRRIWITPDSILAPYEADMALRSLVEETHLLTQFVVHSLEMVLECCFSFGPLESITLIGFDREHLEERGNLERLQRLSKGVVVEDSSTPLAAMPPLLV